MGEPGIDFSPHTIDVIEQREITIEWVVRVLVEPTLVRRNKTDPGLMDAFAVVPGREGRVLRVVYNPGVDSVWVVTVFFDRSMRGKL